MVRLLCRQIYYVESDKHYLIFHTGTGTYRTRGVLREWTEKLPPHRFARCHTSFLVNLEHVNRVGQDRVETDAGPLPLSRSCKGEFMDSFTRYLGGLH